MGTSTICLYCCEKLKIEFPFLHFVSEETTVVCSKWFGNAESEGKTHEFLITSEVEALVSFDVRAGDWVDAIRFHSSHKSSVWFGGHGGSLYRLCFEDGQSCDGIFGTANGQHVLSLGATRARWGKGF